MTHNARNGGIPCCVVLPHNDPVFSLLQLSNARDARHRRAISLSVTCAHMPCPLCTMRCVGLTPNATKKDPFPLPPREESRVVITSPGTRRGALPLCVRIANVPFVCVTSRGGQNLLTNSFFPLLANLRRVLTRSLVFCALRSPISLQDPVGSGTRAARGRMWQATAPRV